MCVCVCGGRELCTVLSGEVVCVFYRTRVRGRKRERKRRALLLCLGVALPHSSSRKEAKYQKINTTFISIQGHFFMFFKMRKHTQSTEPIASSRFSFCVQSVCLSSGVCWVVNSKLGHLLSSSHKVLYFNAECFVVLSIQNSSRVERQFSVCFCVPPVVDLPLTCRHRLGKGKMGCALRSSSLANGFMKERERPILFCFFLLLLPLMTMMMMIARTTHS